MSILVVHLETEAQEKAIKAVLEALKIEFEQEMDETDRIMSNPVMVEKLELGRHDIAKGKGLKIAVKDLWK